MTRALRAILIGGIIGFSISLFVLNFTSDEFQSVFYKVMFVITVIFVVYLYTKQTIQLVRVIRRDRAEKRLDRSIAEPTKYLIKTLEADEEPDMEVVGNLIKSLDETEINHDNLIAFYEDSGSVSYQSLLRELRFIRLLWPTR